MTSHKILLDSSNDSTILPLTESVYLNWYNSGISLQFKNFSTYYSLLTTKSLDENLSDFSKYLQTLFTFTHPVCKRYLLSK